MNENPRMLVAFCLNKYSTANRAIMLAKCSPNVGQHVGMVCGHLEVTLHILSNINKLLTHWRFEHFALDDLRLLTFAMRSFIHNFPYLLDTHTTHTALTLS